MLKKLLKFSKFLLIGIIWTYLFVYISLMFTVAVWNFNYFSLTDWEIINSYWNQGGSIKTAKDYGLFLSLFLFIPLWLLGWKYLYHRNFIAILLLPITSYNNHMIKKYGADTSRIILKNMGSTAKKIDPEELIESKLKTIKSNMEQQERTSELLREKLKEKFNAKIK